MQPMKPLAQISGLALLALLTASGNSVRAAEGAAGFYLLGSKGQMAGFLPPPGGYVQNLAYYYFGSTETTLEIAGVEVAGGVEADVFYDLPAGFWVLPQEVLGGNLALTLFVPVGWKNVSAGIELSGPGGVVLGTDIHNNQLAVGDPVPGASLGWHAGNWHWNVGVLVNVPIGFWQLRNLANIGFNRAAVDTSVAVTWLDPGIGLDLSAAAGITYNFENPETDYKTGTEFHVEWAAIQNFSPTFGVGLAGYHYRQITGDSGPGARLGDFKGRTTALGPTLNYTFNIGRVPVATNFKYLFEIETRNRLSGDAALLTVTIPLSVPPRQNEPAPAAFTRYADSSSP